MQGADFHIGDGESSEEAFNNPVFLQGWVIPPCFMLTDEQIRSGVSHQTKEGTIWESWQDVHTWTLKNF